MDEIPPPSARAHVTMQDVARRAGVSAQTVSNVVNQRSHHVSGDTTERVIAAIADLGYRVNQSARALRKGHTGIVGLGLPTLDSEYYGELAERLAGRFAVHGVRLVIENTGGAVREEVHSLAASRLETYDGYILAIAESESADLNRISSSKPIILLGERALAAPFDHVVMDNIGGGRLATEHLLERGARSIIAVGGTRSPIVSVQTLRTSGYVQAHELRGYAVADELIVGGGIHTAEGYETVTRVLESGLHFDGIFALTDSCAMGALRALHEHDRHVPVVGFDNLSVGRFYTPTLTSIEPGNEEMADVIVEIMMQKLTSAESERAPRQVMTSARLIVRESSA